MSATVVVLTFNSAPRIDQVLAAVLRQRASFPWDLLVVDSGSRDGTLDIVNLFARNHPNRVLLHEIPNVEFGHGKTRNLAARMASGEFVLFLTHDAVPADDQWLESMVGPFSISERVACVYGRQIPWPHCCPTVKREVIESFGRFGPQDAISVQGNAGPEDRRDQDVTECFFSDVNSAIRRSVLLNSVPFRDVPYAEDQAFGRDVLDFGLLKVYTPFGAVFHSNDHSLLAYYRRFYDELSGLNQVTGRNRRAPLARDIAWTAKSTLQDWWFTLRDGDYSPAEKVRWLMEAPLYNLARGVAVRVTARDRIPPWVSRFSSLESNLRRVA